MVLGVGEFLKIKDIFLVLGDIEVCFCEVREGEEIGDFGDNFFCNFCNLDF